MGYCSRRRVLRLSRSRFRVDPAYDRKMNRRDFVIVLAVLLSGCRKAPGPETSHPTPPDHTAQVEQWRAKHEADYRRDYASIAGLFPLKEGVSTAGSGPTSDIRLAE